MKFSRILIRFTHYRCPLACHLMLTTV
jgi:hypothetical protein